MLICVDYLLNASDNTKHFKPTCLLTIYRSLSCPAMSCPAFSASPNEHHVGEIERTVDLTNGRNNSSTLSSSRLGLLWATVVILQAGLDELCA